MPKKTGIGLLLDLALDGRASDPKRWAGERAGNVRLPIQLGPGSHNYGPVSRTLDRSIGRDDNHMEWLLAWYRGQVFGPLGHSGREILSPTYFDAHTVPAHLNIRLCDERGDAPELRQAVIHYLEDELALCTIHRDVAGRVIAAGTRALGASSRSRDAWLNLMLGSPLRNVPPATRLRHFREAPGWHRPELLAACRAYLSTGVIELELDRVLSRIRSASGKLVWERYENGHVSYFPDGPRCYSSPQMAAAVLYGGDAEYLNPARDDDRKLTGISAETRWVAPDVLEARATGKALEGGAWTGSLNLSGLGILEIRREFPMPEGTEGV